MVHRQSERSPDRFVWQQLRFLADGSFIYLQHLLQSWFFDSDGVDNDKADFLRRICDSDDWGLSRNTFQSV